MSQEGHCFRQLVTELYKCNYTFMRKAKQSKLCKIFFGHSQITSMCVGFPEIRRQN